MKASPKSRTRKKPARRSRSADTPLTPRQQKFVNAYCEHGVGTKAAIDAGFAEKSAAVTASQLLTNPKIAEEIQRIRDLAMDRTEATVERIANELGLIAFADLADFVEWGYDPTLEEGPLSPQVRLKPSKELNAAARRSIIEVSQGPNGIKIKLACKVSALDKLGRWRGMFTESTAPVVPSVTMNLNMGGPVAPAPAAAPGG